MAMMDNAAFLISHIRNSFITSDDTGMCEMIIDTEETDRPDKERSTMSSPLESGMESSDNELSHSYDILPDMDFGAHRRRSNTAQRLERMKKEKRGQSKVKQVKWKVAGPEFNAEDSGHLFEKKSLCPADTAEKRGFVISRLSEQLDSSACMAENPFLEYAKFDGKASVGVSTKKIDIYLTMAPPEDRSYPMTVVVVAAARICDLVGLICWQYTIERREPSLSEDTRRYCLHIAEDDGEVDMDFPSLDSREPVSKFGFTKLALVEKELPAQTDRSSIIVTVNIPNRGFNKFHVESLNVNMRDILQKVLKRRKLRIRPGQAYNLEKQGAAGVPVDLDATLASLDTLEFCLVRENSSRGDSMYIEEGKSSKIAESLTSHQYKSYIVNMVSKIRTKTEVQLDACQFGTAYSILRLAASVMLKTHGHNKKTSLKHHVPSNRVSGEKVEIDPVASKSGARIFRQRAVTYDADNIASCDMLEDKGTGKSLFRLTHMSGHDYKHHDFEADSERCNEIVHKINNILELRLSPVRKEYIAQRDKKLQRKRDSFTLGFS